LINISSVNEFFHDEWINIANTNIGKFLEKSGINNILRTIISTSLYKHHNEELKKVYSYLCDDLSKKIFTDLLKYRKYRKNIIFKDDISYPAYFIEEILHFSQNEIFVDVGAAKGETLLDFIKMVNGRYKYIYAFEPDESSYLEIEKLIEKNKINDISVYKSGLSNTEGVIRFFDRSYQSTVCNKGNKEIKIITLDKLLLDKKVSFIKMDIEGSELNAIKGAEKIIKMYHPNLAICIYHRMQDIYEIPMYIKELVPEYKLYIRKHDLGAEETVLYATVR